VSKPKPARTPKQKQKPKAAQKLVMGPRAARIGDSRDAAAACRTPTLRGGLITGARVMLWIAIHPMPQSARDVSTALGLDMKYAHDVLSRLAATKLLTRSSRLSRSTKPVYVYTTFGGSYAVPALAPRNPSSSD